MRGNAVALLFIPMALQLACGGAPNGRDGGLPADEVSLSAKQLLGKRLFEDTSLSEPVGQACASCHDAARAFTGNNDSRIAAVALGSRPEVFGNRNVPTVMYASFSPTFTFIPEPGSDAGELTGMGGQFLDGRADDLIAQAKGPFLNPREMNNADEEAVIAKVRSARYAPLFRSVFGDAALDDAATAYHHVAEAIAAFEMTDRFHPFSSRFDDSLRGQGQLTATEARGFALFKDPEKGNCIACHVGNPDSRNPTDWLFTDFTYNNLGLPRNADIPDNTDASYFDLGLCMQPGLLNRVPPEFDILSACGGFKVSTLRNIELTAPYGHNGYFKELRDVVRFYATRDTQPELWFPVDKTGYIHKFNDVPYVFLANVVVEVPFDRRRGEKPRLTDEEVDAVVAFLMTLSDDLSGEPR